VGAQNEILRAFKRVSETLRVIFGRIFASRVGREHKGRHSSDFSAVIDAGQSAFAFCKDKPVALAFETVRMFDSGGAYICAVCGKFEVFIVHGRFVIFDIKAGNDEVNAGFFEFAICKAVSTKQFGSAHFKPDGVNRVMYDTGLVGFTVPRHDGYCMGVNCNFYREFHIFSSLLRLTQNRVFASLRARNLQRFF